MKPSRLTWSLLAALPLTLAPAACEDGVTGTPDGQDHPLQPGHSAVENGSKVTLTVEGAAFVPGTAVTLVLDNRSGERVGYNLCFHALERRSGQAWVPAEEHEDRICTLELRILASGETAEYPAELPDALPGGEYRFRVTIQLMERDEHWDLVTEPFGVEG